MVVFLGPKDVAARLGISERGAARLMKRGEIPSFRAGVKPWRTTELHLEGYAIRRTLEEQNQLKIKVILPSGGLVIGSQRPGSRERKPA